MEPSSLLLGICFWREGFAATFGPEQKGRKGVRGIDNTHPRGRGGGERIRVPRDGETCGQLHGALAAGALERVAAPNFEDEAAPGGRMSRDRLLGGAGIRRFNSQKCSMFCESYEKIRSAY
jgi:hypothetical protein